MPTENAGKLLGPSSITASESSFVAYGVILPLKALKLGRLAVVTCPEPLIDSRE